MNLSTKLAYKSYKILKKSKIIKYVVSMLYIYTVYIYTGCLKLKYYDDILYNIFKFILKQYILKYIILK